MPMMITGMSGGALSADAKIAPARGARQASSSTTGDGGMLPTERAHPFRGVEMAYAWRSSTASS
jgi:glutamate synthase domain-containing protein 2